MIFVLRLEAVRCGCIPLAPKSLVYPEIYPKEYLFETHDEFFFKLKSWCLNKDLLFNMKNSFDINIEKFESKRLLPKYLLLFDDMC